MKNLIVIMLVVALGAPTGAETIAFDSGRWVLYDAEVVEHDGRQCLIGSAYLPNIEFTDGVIEYDLWVDGTRGYPGVTFRATSQFAYEYVYCRPHVSNRPDALQYTPAFNGVAGWQLYSGPGFTAAADIPTGQWIPVRLEVIAGRGRLYFGDLAAPALVMDDLKHVSTEGPVAIRSVHNRTAIFSNFRVTKTTDLDFGPAPAPRRLRGLVTSWELSQPFRATDVDFEAYPDITPEPLLWRTVAAEPDGLLDIARYVRRSLNGEADVAFARLTLHAEEAQTKVFNFGYSDIVTVCLNGVPVFTGNSSYQSRDETFTGVIGLHDALHLPLRAGDNELLFCVVESFGGWGLMAQDTTQDWFAPGLERVWEMRLGNRMPESALLDPDRDVLYVTHYFNGGGEFIAKVSVEGEMLEREWIKGLSRPTGLILHDDRLWVVDRRALLEVDPAAGAVVARHEIPGAAFPNDVAFDDAGVAYVSDTRGNCIHRLRDGAWERWFEGPDIDQPNGLLWDGDRLLYGNQGDGSLKAVDPGNLDVTTIAAFGDDANVDGLRHDGEGGWFVSDFDGRLYRVTREGEVAVILDTTASGRTCADFEFVPKCELLVVPGLYDNRLTAYRLGDH